MICPYCGAEMTPTGNNWFLCSECGATHNTAKQRKRKRKEMKASNASQ